jgi:hypothetical protein
LIDKTCIDKERMKRWNFWDRFQVLRWPESLEIAGESRRLL